MTISLCCWQPLLTPHQAHTLRALADGEGAAIKAVASIRESTERTRQGWRTDTDEILAAEVLPQRGWRRRIRALMGEDGDRIHLFGSPFELSKMSFALALALWRKRTVFLISEPYSTARSGYLDDRSPWLSSFKRRLRPFLYRVYGRLIRDRVAGVFAISPAAVAQYRRMGVPPERIFPFGYFIPRDDAPKQPAVPENATLRVAYVGSFIRRKGVEILVAAFAAEALAAADARLDLFGPAEGKTIPLPNDRVRYAGAIPFGEAQRVLARYDLVVVPSLFDGWAVVVNEAVFAGAAVLASDAVGAGAMVEHWRCGLRFPAGDSGALAGRIADLAADRRAMDHLKAATGRLAPLILPSAAGHYMAECIKAAAAGREAPPAPWY